MRAPWSLPALWRWASLGEVSRVEADLRAPQEYGTLPHIAPNHIESKTGRLLPYTTVAEDKVISGKHLFHPGQILYSKIRPYLAKAIVVDFTGMCSADMYPIGTDLETRYLHRWLLSPAFTGIVSQNQGRTVLPKVNQDALMRLPVPVPPVNEQRRIVEKIEALFERSRRARQALDAIPPLIERLRQSILAAAFRGDLTADWRAKHPDVEPADRLLQRIRAERRQRWEQAYLDKLRAKGKAPKDAHWKNRYKEPAALDSSRLPKLPSGWAYFRLPEAVEASSDAIKTGPFGSLLKKAEHLATGVPVIGVENIRSMQFVPGIKVFISEKKATELKKYDARPGDILVSRSGTVGEVCVMPEGMGAACISSNLMRIRLLPDSILPQLLCMVFNGSPLVLEQVATLCSGSTRDFLNQSILSRIILPLPPLQEQHAIVHAVHAAFSQIELTSVAAKRASSDLARLEMAILAKAFRGELVPQDPNDEPASVLLERIRAARQQDTRSTKRGKRARPAEPDEPAPATPRARVRTEAPPSATTQPAKRAAVNTRTEAPPSATTQPAKRAAVDTRPEPPPRATRDARHTPEPVQTSLPFGLADHDPEAIQDVIYAALWGLGPMESDAAVRVVGEALRDRGLVQYQRLRSDGALYADIKKAIDVAVRAGWLDRPRRGHVRAVEPDPRAYTIDDWRMALLGALDGQPVDRDQATTLAAEWARDNLGLEYKRLRAGGVIESGIKSAINSAIRRGELDRVDATRIQRRT